MMEAAEKHYFVCANTAEGFVDYFRSNLAGLDRVFILKGGSGTGKSTLMSRLGKAYQECAYAVDYIHCSSDANSLDGVIIADLSVAVVDGTAPHVIEPVLPGAIEDYVNLGLALDRSKLAPHKEEMLSLKKEISQCYNQVYADLNQAALILEKSQVKVQEAEPLAQERQKKIIEEILGKNVLMKKAVARHRFCGALTPKGDVYPGLEMVKDIERRYFISGQQASMMLKLLSVAALERGYEVELYHDHLRPNQLIFVHVPEKSLAVLDYGYPALRKLRRAADQWYDIDGAVESVLESPEKNQSSEASQEMIRKASSALQAARQAHGKLEQYYYPAVDFEIVEQIYDSIRAQIDAIG